MSQHLTLLEQSSGRALIVVYNPAAEAVYGYERDADGRWRDASHNNVNPWTILSRETLLAFREATAQEATALLVQAQASVPEATVLEIPAAKVSPPYRAECAHKARQNIEIRALCGAVIYGQTMAGVRQLLGKLAR